MAEQAEALEHEDELNLNDDGDGGSDGIDQGHGDQGGDGLDDQTGGLGEGGDAGDEADEFEISFGDEAAPASGRGDNSDLVRHLRAEVRKRDEELAGLRRAQPPQPQTIDPGPEPTLEDCDWDGDKFKSEFVAWQERKRKADEATAQTQQAARAEQEKFQARLDAYNGGKTALKAKDFDVAEAAVMSGFSPMQQAVALKAAKEPAKLVYALGRHPQKLAELAKLSDPIEFAVAVSEIEGKLKVTQRTRTPPDPDTPVRGSAPLTKGVDRHLERLEAEAARTNDRSKVIAYRRELKAKGRS